ncbi:MAG: nucleoside triphosphate pyrophosphohydrolase [Proteobacteria bacterium]|nr:nucleoside triphosphate pyrophosphohydrolase [Pseudomonadota bacterium]
MSQSNRRLADATDALVQLMARLRDRERGCPWDVEQTFTTIAPYTIEEAYEVADAIQRQDMPALREELGDLLFQVVFHARMAEEAGHFDFTDVAEALTAKMTTRHPHVFSERDQRTAEEQTRAWETMKAEERLKKRLKDGSAPSLLDDVPMALPALMRAEKLTRRAARINFDWPTPDEVLAKLEEELAELSEARMGDDEDALIDEMGDLLFVMANLARKLKVDPEEALRRANAKFTRRFQYIERRLAEQGRAGPQALDEMEALWLEAKRTERT